MSATPDSCIHLTIDDVKEIHDLVIAEFGGSRGVRDEGLLHSAVAAAQATVGGESPFADLTEVAAAYLFYLCRNHSFIDGNKRTAMTAAIVFLRLNSVGVVPDSDKWEALILDVAASRVDRDAATQRLKALVARKR
ncbi:MAG TPA: type II toxin-antitoxin system death-on-curing family toxin [Burkholderiales bacterium]|jgi:death-on-curing protein|nr:type II toxin-antitoxin system death-on-curing family toxin [Burkholderiales bacterium]HXD52024.1 type II toxin-antitoxin system death-on-curing family toxin [Burkholderiales bacterium]